MSEDGDRRPRPGREFVALIGSLCDKRAWLSPVVTIVGSIVAAAAFASLSWWSIGGGVALVVVTLVQSAASWWRKEEERESGNRAMDALLLLPNGVINLANLVSEYALNGGERGTFGRALQQATGACLLAFREQDGIRAAIYRIDDGGTTMSRRAHSGRPEESEGFDLTNRRGRFAFRALKKGEPVVVGDIREQPQKWAGSGRGYRSFVTVPLAVKKQGYGLLTVDSPVVDRFGEIEVVYIRTIASLVEALLVQEVAGLGEGTAS